MRFDGDQALPAGPRPLLRPNRRLTALARRLARLAEPLLPSPQMFLGVEIAAEGELCLSWWRHDFQPFAQISAVPQGFCPPTTPEGALQDAGADLLAYLAGRWPTPPRRLGAITDGIGVAFAPDHPSLGESGWLLRQAGGLGGLVAILPFDPTGPCSVFEGERGSLH